MGKLFLASTFSEVYPMVSQLLQNKQKGEKVLCITTAAEDKEGFRQWLQDDIDALKKIGLEPIIYTITGKKQTDFTKDFENIRYVFMSGGNTFYLLEKAQQSGFIPFITQFIQQKDTVYFGSSAGSAIAGADIYPLINLDDPTIAPQLQGYEGFRFIDLTLLPHWGNEKFKNSYLNLGLAHVYNVKYKLVLLTDKQFLYGEDDGKYSILEV